MFFKKVDLRERDDGKWELWIKKGDAVFEVIILDSSELQALVGKYKSLQ